VRRFADLVRFVLGETGVPYDWEYADRAGKSDCCCQQPGRLREPQLPQPSVELVPTRESAAHQYMSVANQEADWLWAPPSAQVS
jgi:hypothetical protein